MKNDTPKQDSQSDKHFYDYLNSVLLPMDSE